MKIAFLNDTHCGIRNSSDVFLDNAEKFYEEVFFPYLLENDIKHIVHLGDYYDNRKFINFRALNRNRKMFLAKLREYDIKMDIILGNHDTYYKNTNDLNSLKELLGHYMDEVNIIHEPTTMNYNGLEFALVPWINPENYESTIQFINKTPAKYLGGHFDIVGFEMIKGVVSTHGLDPTLFERFQAVYSGHYHVKSSNANIHYLGSQMEFFWNDAHNQKYFHIFDTDTQELIQVYNPHTLFHRIYYDDTKQNYLEYDFSQVDNKFVKIVVINKKDLFTFDRFVDKIQSCKIHELKIQENFSEFVGDQVDDAEVLLEDTNTLLNSYIDGVDTELDKDRIKTQMNELMIEAQTLEIA
jgi:DNA repair exonuclease SbcCD nuclease subunit